MTYPISDIKRPQKPSWGMYRYFKAKRTKYANFHTIETRDSKHILQCDKDFQVLCLLSQNAPYKYNMVYSNYLEK